VINRHSGSRLKLILASGLSILRGNSFARQLRLLGGELSRRGHELWLIGQAPGAGRASPAREPSDVAALDLAGLLEIESVFDPDAVLLLGYPDQFHFLPAAERLRSRVFLWAQVSRPPAPGQPRCLFVPLTATTSAYLAGAGLETSGAVVPHAVDTEVFLPRENGDRRRGDFGLGGGPVFGSVGANTTRKRFDRLIAAFSLVAAEKPEAELLIKTDRERWVGGFDLPGLAEARGLAGRVRLVTRELDDESLSGFYSSLDVYVHSAEWEGFGIPVIEAMACGIPVVAPDIQGPAELLPYRGTVVREGEVVEEDGTRLFLVEPRALARTMARLAGDGTLRAQLGRLGRRAAVERYDLRHVADLWESLLAAPAFPAGTA
jgi:glycosyltransferase involved in cell wall biosynthesis